MPTPNETITVSPTVAGADIPPRPSRLQLACPPEEPVSFRNSSSSTWRPLAQQQPSSELAMPYQQQQQQQLSPTSSSSSSDDETSAMATTVVKEVGRDVPSAEPSPTLEPKHRNHNHNSNINHHLNSQQPASHGLPLSSESPFVSSLSYEFSARRLLPSSSSSFLRPGSKFCGKQTSDRSTYDVHVELKHVDMSESFLCGYLRIQGLTEDHPTLTTYFEGEMIGDKYTFQTRRPEWGSSEKNDFQHWARFPAYRPLANKAKRAEFNFKNFAQREHIFMRWKEYFLVPDHRVKQISGASFEGFYYICFNQLTGGVTGIYFHAKSEKFQKLELCHVPERYFGAVEFR